MKCYYCGSEIDHGITCHVCGHHYSGQAKCSLCLTRVFLGQEYCSRCGSPTVYRKSNTIKKITPDTIKHTAKSHNYHTMSPSYNYQTNAYDYHENQSTYKKRNSYYQKNKKIAIAKGEKRKNIRLAWLIILAIFVFIFVESGIVTDLMESNFIENLFEDDLPAAKEADEISSLQLTEDSDQNQYNLNVSHGGRVFSYNHQLFFSTNDGFGLRRYDQDLNNYEIIQEGYSFYDLYIFQDQLYYLDDLDCYMRSDLDGNHTQTIVEDVKECYQN